MYCDGSDGLEHGCCGWATISRQKGGAVADDGCDAIIGNINIANTAVPLIDYIVSLGRRRLFEDDLDGVKELGRCGRAAVAAESWLFWGSCEGENETGDGIHTPNTVITGVGDIELIIESVKAETDGVSQLSGRREAIIAGPAWDAGASGSNDITRID